MPWGRSPREEPNPDPTLAALSAGATLATANDRLARQLTLLYNRLHAQSGDAVWESPDILPWRAWLRRCWQANLDAGRGDQRVLLSQAQEEALWQRIIGESEGSDSLLDLSGAASEAMAAYSLLCSWRLSLAEPHFSLFEDAAAFQRWARQFERTLQTNGWVSFAQLESDLARRVREREVRPPTRLLHAGFDELAPSQQDLLGALRSEGCVVEDLALRGQPGFAARARLPDAASELHAAAQWARDRLAASPEARIGVVVPGLAAVRKVAARIFDEALPRSAFHISAGAALTEIPVIGAALLVLALGRGRISGAEAGLLLRSPFIAGAGMELGRRALLDAELRRLGLAEVRLARLEREAKAASLELARRLRGLRRAVALMSGLQGASVWARRFSRLLRVAGWPGDRTPDSSEHQAMECWNDLLSEFAALETVASPMDYASALSRLRRMAAEATFAPADEEAPVQVMGLLEAAGSVFDHLWVTGLEDRAWPAPPRPNPFLPLPLQRSADLPHSSADRELAYARMVTARMLASAPEVVVSYPRREGDTDLRPSPLILGLSETTPPATTRMPQRDTPRLEELEDSAGPPLPERATPRGGTGIIERQSACPFRAFAEYRLGARPLEEPAAGFSPLERGLVLHSALKILWDELKSHAALVASTADELAAIVSRVVRQAVAKQVRGRGVESMPYLQSLERRRLERLLMEWLEIERARSPFEVVATEDKRRISMGGLELDLRTDRVDRLDDHRHIIIDYKSGESKPSEWEGDRPDAPQLPLYAATDTARVAALAFARIAPGESGFKGLGEDAGVPGVEEYSNSRPGKAAGDSLGEHIGEWRITLERLTREFAEGQAAVAPKTAKTCRGCPLPALCRIGELPARIEEDGDE